MVPSAAIVLTLAMAPLAFAQVPVSLGDELLKWAGPGAAAKGFQAERLEGFLKARAQDPKSGGSATWKPWLEGLVDAGSPSLKAWALSRLAEAGVESAYAPLEKAAYAHLKLLREVQEMEKDPKLVLDPPPLGTTALPGSFRMPPGSPFLALLEARIQARKEQDVTVPEFAVLAYNTHPGQFPLIRALAAQVSFRPGTSENGFLVKESRSLAAGNLNYLNDPRLWLLMDWSAVWGTDAQRLELSKTISPRFVDWYRSLLYWMQTQPLVAGRTPPDPAWEGRPVAAPLAHGAKTDGPATEARKAMGLEGPLGGAVASSPLSWFTTASADLLIGSNGSVRALRLHPSPWVGNYAAILGGTVGRWRFPAGRDGRIVQVVVPFFNFQQAGEREIRAWQNAWLRTVE